MSPTSAAELDSLVSELRRTAELLRGGQASGEQAAALVERSAELAASLSSALEREARAAQAELPGAAGGPPAGQRTLL